MFWTDGSVLGILGWSINRLGWYALKIGPVPCNYTFNESWILIRFLREAYNHRITVSGFASKAE
jgi:hypothetical protein